MTSNVVELSVARRADPSSPERLLERLAAGEVEAVTHVYGLHHAAVRAFARRMLSDDAAAEDVVHDTFVALPSAASRFRGDAALRTLVFSIAVNLCRRRIRSATRQRRAFDALAQEPVEPPGTPEAELRRRRLAASLRRGLETLSIEHREAFVLCVVEERTSTEVAEIVGIPEGTVRTRVFHARAKLRAFLEAEGLG